MGHLRLANNLDERNPQSWGINRKIELHHSSVYAPLAGEIDDTL